MPRRSFKQRLLQLAEEEAGRHNYQISSSVQDNLKELIYSGVEKMTSLEFLSELRRNEVETNLCRLIESMVKDARSRNISQTIDLHAFFRVRMKMDPFWPFL